ncbi:MAG: 2,3-bisphosphoglycerate-independent phosphoglycerate mutase [Gemmatimonadetes bacterium]|nr:2,3-bisphosphoglycerate-independent phosphoglycerate mutase [Gemmatimonadota bacterium]
MDSIQLPDDLTRRDGGGSILLVVLDGLGGLPDPDRRRTELEAAKTPSLDALAARSSLGMTIPIGHGITPGSGPAHLALFGYDPLRWVIGRGVLSALGVGFDLASGDVAARLNLATLDPKGRITDRRAGRPSDAEGRRIVERVKGAVSLDGPEEFFLVHEKEHRAVLVLRGAGLEAEVSDTDPQVEGVPPLVPEGRTPGSVRTAQLVSRFLDQAHAALRGEPALSGLLARGFARYDPLPTITERFGLQGVAVANYPMYRGVARLLGMRVPGVPSTDDESVTLLTKHFDPSAFHFLHFKAVDARGEDGDFDAKVRAIEAVDALMPRLTALAPDVLVVTGDHSTPARMKAHSWHHVPLLLSSKWARPTGSEFSESACRGGDLGTFEARHLMSLALAHAGRLSKFGA